MAEADRSARAQAETDEALVQAILDGSDDAFEVLYRRYLRRVFLLKKVKCLSLAKLGFVVQRI